MSKHLTPVQVCEALIGKPEKIGKAAGVDAKTPYAWRRPSNNRDAGDIPLRPARRLLAYAARWRIPLTPDHIIFGASEIEILQLRRAMQDEGQTLPACAWLGDALPQVAAQ